MGVTAFMVQMYTDEAQTLEKQELSTFLSFGQFQWQPGTNRAEARGYCQICTAESFDPDLSPHAPNGKAAVMDSTSPDNVFDKM
jgi:hypothetical protein